MLTGCRKSEILTLRWAGVDRMAGEFRLRDGKHGPRVVPLTTSALKGLDGIERVEGNPGVIWSPKPGICLIGLNYYWNRFRGCAELEGVRIHDLRNSHASRALALSESLTMIGRLLVHSKAGTTARYAHFVHAAETAEVARTGAHLAPRSHTTKVLLAPSSNVVWRKHSSLLPWYRAFQTSLGRALSPETIALAMPLPDTS